MFFVESQHWGVLCSAQGNFFLSPTSTYLLFFPNSFRHKSQFTLSGHIFKGKNMFPEEPYAKWTSHLWSQNSQRLSSDSHRKWNEDVSELQQRVLQREEGQCSPAQAPAPLIFGPWRILKEVRDLFQGPCVEASLIRFESWSRAAESLEVWFKPGCCLVFLAQRVAQCFITQSDW